MPSDAPQHGFRDQALLALLHSYTGDARCLLRRHPEADRLVSAFAAPARALAKVLHAETEAPAAAQGSAIKPSLPCRARLEYFLLRGKASEPEAGSTGGGARSKAGSTAAGRKEDRP
ncbi:MAG: hypothetical protein GIKADHBN_03038 [Phycisphaerales bacterium]|nr:hypothetical protein [Phycisphaerales bacterium]MCK6476015.1 hypothetical protein [Phycisphaerales bacterium]